VLTILDADWYDRGGNHVLMTRSSPDLDNPKLHFKGVPIDVEIRDMFITQTGNVLDPKKMKIWSLPENVSRPWVFPSRFVCSLAMSKQPYNEFTAHYPKPVSN